MSEGNDIVIERAFDIEALSLFNCGVREIDQLIHKKQGGLLSFICEVPCEFYIIRKDESPIALFVLSNRTITVKDERYNSLEIDFIAEQNAREADFSFLTTAAFINKRYDASGFYVKCGFVKNGEKTGNTIPMYKYLQSTNP